MFLHALQHVDLDCAVRKTDTEKLGDVSAWCSALKLPKHLGKEGLIQWGGGGLKNLSSYSCKYVVIFSWK